MNIPIIDWQLSIQLAGNNIHHAREFLQLLVNDLTEQLKIIRDHTTRNQIDLLKKALHKLLGGLSYSGALRLKAATTTFYNAVKNNEDTALTFLAFETEAHLFIEHAKCKL